MNSDLQTSNDDLLKRERELFAELLVILGEENRFRALIRKITQLLQDGSGCQAVGIRLRQGDDYPYYETRGFPHEFVLAETKLCERDAEGKLIPDKTGKPVLACMCGAVIEGRIDPARPFFTEFGSFWTNSTSTLLAADGQSGLLGPTRNRCNREGYESVALVPLRVQGRTLGLIQFNDKQAGKFSSALIALFERLAVGAALALDHRLAHNALRQSAKSTRSLYEKTPAMLHSIDRDGCLVAVSDYWLQKMGYAREEVIGRKITDFLTSASCEKAEKQNLPLFFKTGSAFDVEYQFITKSGAIMDVLLSAVSEKGPDGEMLRSLAVLTDISERKLAERALHQSEAKYRMVVDNSLAGIFVIQAGRFVFVNQRMAHMHGYEHPDELVGRHFWELVHPLDREMVKERGLRRERGEVLPERYECRSLRKDGTFIWVDVRARLQQLNDKNAVLGNIIDVSEAKQALDALSRKEIELRQKADDLEELNVTLKILLERREKEKASIEKNVLLNVRNLVVPLLKRLEEARNLDEVATLSKLLKGHVSELTLGFSNTLAAKSHDLTAMEIQVAKLIQEGKSSREIAAIFRISPKAVAFHRNNIRRKLKLTHRKINLQVYLNSLG